MVAGAGRSPRLTARVMPFALIPKIHWRSSVVSTRSGEKLARRAPKLSVRLEGGVFILAPPVPADAASEASVRSGRTGRMRSRAKWGPAPAALMRSGGMAGRGGNPGACACLRRTRDAWSCAPPARAEPTRAHSRMVDTAEAITSWRLSWLTVRHLGHALRSRSCRWENGTVLELFGTKWCKIHVLSPFRVESVMCYEHTIGLTAPRLPPPRRLRSGFMSTSQYQQRRSTLHPKSSHQTTHPAIPGVPMLNG